jgi:hypothetical protein
LSRSSTSPLAAWATQVEGARRARWGWPLRQGRLRSRCRCREPARHPRGDRRRSAPSGPPGSGSCSSETESPTTPTGTLVAAESEAEIPAQHPSDAITTRVLIPNYALRDSITAGRCDCRSHQPKERHDTQRTQRVPRQRHCEKRGAHDEPPSCLACGARNDSCEPTIKIRSALVHMHCVVPRLGAAPMTSPRSDPNLRLRPNRQEAPVRDRPIASITAQVVEASGAQERPAAAIRRPSGSSTKRLDPGVLVAHLGHLLAAAWALCGSRESAEDLVQETVARILSRPRLLRAGAERAYLMQTLRNTFLTSRRTSACRPHAVTTLEELDAADPRTGARRDRCAGVPGDRPAAGVIPVGASGSRRHGPLLPRGGASVGCARGNDHNAAVPRSPAGGARA